MLCHAVLLTAADTETSAVLDVLREVKIPTNLNTDRGFDTHCFTMNASDGPISCSVIQVNDKDVDNANEIIRDILNYLRPELMLIVGFCSEFSAQMREQDVIIAKRLFYVEKKKISEEWPITIPVVCECSERVLKLSQELNDKRELDGALGGHTLYIGKDLASGDESNILHDTSLVESLRRFSTDIFGFVQNGTGLLASMQKAGGPQWAGLQIGMIKGISHTRDTQLQAALQSGKVALAVLERFSYAKASDSNLAINLAPSKIAKLRAAIATILITDPQLDSFCQDYFSDAFTRFTVGMDRITKVNLLLQLYPEAEISARLDEIVQSHGLLPAHAPSSRKYWFMLLPLAVALSTSLLFYLKSRRVEAPVQMHAPKLPPFPGMIHLSGGAFIMGSQPEEVTANLSACQIQFGSRCNREALEREQPAHEVSVDPFFLDASEVTNADVAHWLSLQVGLVVEKERLVFAAETLLLDLHPKYSGLRSEQGRFHIIPERAQEPVVLITWNGASRYCTSQGKRLPTEAEFEYAARGVTRRTFPWGEQPPSCDGVVFGRGAEGPCTVAVAKPDRGRVSPQDRTLDGVFDLGGNVAEWVQEPFFRSYRTCGQACLDGSKSGAGERVIRGGYYDARSAELRGAARQHAAPDVALHNVGFRCAASAERPIEVSAKKKEGT